MSKNNVRVRFAPSPTGFMHLGNVRAALVNFLFARQNKGTFILRIEDTDQQRLIDPEGRQIIDDLDWLGLAYDEGPKVGGPYAPYYQSERTSLYKSYLKQSEEKNLIYRCFCTTEELEKKRQRQLALKQPPRYDRTCLQLTEADIQGKLITKTPFIWRFKLDYNKTISFYDLAHKMMHFELKHFSDVPITRQDGSFTFLFANFIDDLEMKITHVFRGEDHLTNTAAQAAMYEAFQAEVPVFWHLPIISNAEGKKLSKRDFGFSLTDLRNAGFLPEALVNYLGIIGHSVHDEIMDLQTLSERFDFEHLSSSGHIRYDLEKLRWVNHQWIMKYDIQKLTQLCKPYLISADTKFEKISDSDLLALLRPLQAELTTLQEAPEALRFVIHRPDIDQELVRTHHIEKYKTFFADAFSAVDGLSPQDAATKIQALCKERGVPVKDIFSLMRIALTGKPQGPSVKDLLLMLPADEISERLSILV